jgi:hypothetical protein
MGIEEGVGDFAGVGDCGLAAFFDAASAAFSFASL